MGNNKAEAAVTSRSKQNYDIHINHRIIILQAYLLVMKISGNYMLEGNLSRSVFYFFILYLIVY
jgi:hypothetical protein